MHEQIDILVTTTFGLEAVVVRELQALGLEGKPLSTGRVLVRGTLEDVPKLNVRLRTADRVLIRVGHFPARDFDELFEGVKTLAWEKWVPHDFAFPVSGRSVRSQLSSVPAVQRATKKAIVERLHKAHDRMVLPESGPPVEIEVGLLRDEATFTIDTSGAGLHKRGYRPMVGPAALKETLAAGIVLLSNWTHERPLIDPFCGTGTIAIEAAMIGLDIAPGLRRTFDAERWPLLGEEMWAKAREEAASIPRRKLAYSIHAYDVDDYSLSLARGAAKAAGVETSIHFKKQDFSALSSKAEYGVIVSNPPYGERMGEDEAIEALYQLMPRVLRKLPTWSFHLLSGRLDLESLFGQEATRRRKLYNSKIECALFSFLGPKPPWMIEGRGGAARENAPGTTGTAREEAGLNPQLAEGAELERGVDVPEDSPRPELHREPKNHDPQVAEEIVTQAPNAEPRAAKNVAPVFGGLRERDVREAGDFRACLAKNAKHLRRYPARGITCYRVYERDCPDVPLIVDRYEDRVHVTEYEREHSRSSAQQGDWWDLMRRTVAEVLEVPEKYVYTKEKHRQRGLTQHEKVSHEKHTFHAHENGLTFEVNLSDYIDTGLFLDHRLTRQMVREQAAGKRMLNLYCYTGSFTVYAAAGGAASTTSVDLSNTYLEWTARNMALNGLLQGEHRKKHDFLREDVMAWLRGHPGAKGGLYDLAIVDPPTFSNSKSTEDDWEVQRDHGELLALTARLMAPGGVIYFSNNFRRFKLDELGLSATGMKVREISTQTVPPEYRNRRIHRCWRIVVGAQETGNSAQTEHA